MRSQIVGRRGLTIGYVLAASAFLSVIAMAVAAMATSSLGFASRYSAGLDATYLAEAAVNRALAKVHQQNDFGTHPGDQVVVQPDPSDKTRMAALTFDDTAGVPYATNNYLGTGAIRGWEGASVPAQSVRLVAVGTSHGMIRTLDVLTNVPPFPYVLASGGALVANGSLDVRGATSMADFASQTASDPPGSDTSAGVVSNISINATQASYVSGDVTAPGSVSLPNGSYVGGMVRTGTAMLPAITAAQMAAKWDPSGKQGVVTLPGASGDLTGLSGMNVCNGDLTVTGNVSLAGGLLFVKGGLTVTGSLSGKGAVIVQGKTTIGGAASMASDTVTALISDGDVAITGSGLKSYFQGLVYTNGSFTATSVTVAGVFIATGTTSLGGGSPGAITLSSARAVYVADAARFGLTVQGAATGPSLVGRPITTGRPGRKGFNGIYQVEFANLNTPAYTAITTGQTVMPLPGTTTGSAETVSPSGKPYFLAKSGSGIWLQCVYLGAAIGSDTSKTGVQSSPLAVSGSLIGATIISGKQGPFTLQRADLTNLTYFSTSNGATTRLTYAQAEAIAKNSGTTVEDMYNYLFNCQTAALNAANQSTQSSQGGASLAADFTLNQFLQDTIPFRIISWKDL